MISLKEQIAPSFYSVHADIVRAGHSHYWLPGGRGSTKSSFASLETVFGIMRDAGLGIQSHAVVLRRYGVAMRESVLAQVEWAINKLGASHLWDIRVSPMQAVYRPTGQRIIFRGVDDATKLKSIKVSIGEIRYVWLEELTEFEGAEKVRSLLQSLVRSDGRVIVFYTYNPPKAIRSWVNVDVQQARPDRLVHRSDYLSVPPAWLGQQFIADAEHLKEVNPTAYAHEYLGEVTGTGGEVFTNLTLREITDDEIAQFDRIRNGLDWGYAADPFCYVRMHYDKTRRRLYLFYEVYQLRLSNRKAAELLQPIVGRELVVCDSAEPKSIDDIRDLGINAQKSIKGRDSRDYGIKWLQDLEEIIIDPVRCPNAAREFGAYEIGRDRDGNLLARFPEEDDHSIDAARYGCGDDMQRPRMRVLQ